MTKDTELIERIEATITNGLGYDFAESPYHETAFQLQAHLAMMDMATGKRAGPPGLQELLDNPLVPDEEVYSQVQRLVLKVFDELN